MGGAHVLERDVLVDTEPGDGSRAPITGPPTEFSRTPTTVRRAAPVPGQHTDEVFAGLGVSAERLADLPARRVI